MGLAKIINTSTKVGIVASALTGTYFMGDYLINDVDRTNFIGIWGSVIGGISLYLVENVSRRHMNSKEINL